MTEILDTINRAIAERTAHLSPRNAELLALVPVVRQRDHIIGESTVTTQSLGVHDPSDRAGYAIPYFDAKGERVPHVNVRFLQHSDAAPKYLAPRGSKPRLYFPRTDTGPVDWTDIGEYPDRRLIVTEGEFKAFTATAMGLPAVAVPGVDCFDGRRQGTPLIEGFKDLPLKELEVELVFDSDIVHKPEVREALDRAVGALLKAGVSHIKLVDLPEQLGKVGLDDYLIAHGVEAFLELPRRAPDGLAELPRFLEDYLYLAHGNGMVLRRTAPLEPHMTVAGLAMADPAKVRVGRREIPVAKLWSESPEKITVHGVRYVPAAEEFIEEHGGRYVNVWKSPGPSDKELEAPAAELWLDLLKHLFGSDDDAMNWFNMWCAYPVKHPGTKLYTCALLWSVHGGVGKGLVAAAMGRVYGLSNSTFLREASLNADFNDWIHSQWVTVEELSGASRNARGAVIRDLVTADNVLVNQKYRQAYNAKVYANFYFNSNHANPIEVRDGERRVFAYQSKAKPISDDFAGRFARAFIQGGGALTAGLRSYFQNAVDLERFNPSGRAYETFALEDLQESTARPFTAWLRGAREWRSFAIENHIPQSRSLFTSTELAHLFNAQSDIRMSPVQVGTYIRECPFVEPVPATGCGKVNLHDGRVTRVYALRRANEWRDKRPKEIAAAYEAEIEATSPASLD